LLRLSPSSKDALNSLNEAKIP